MSTKSLFKRSIALFLVLVMTLVFAGCQKQQAQKPAEGKYKAGTYTGNGKGIHGDVVVDVTVDENNIKEVKVTKHEETPGVSDAAISDMPKKIVEAQSADVDAVSGATITSNAIKEAVKAALAQASGK